MVTIALQFEFNNSTRARREDSIICPDNHKNIANYNVVRIYEAPSRLPALAGDLHDS